jgi:1-deoxy-D-xylulose-5-phosphate synthase
MLLPSIETPSDLRLLTDEQLAELADEIRAFIVDAVTKTGGHLGSNLGVVELTLALHRVFDSPRDVLLFDTGHQAYVHKLLTGRRYGFKDLRQRGGLSGYPSRAESEHDWIENSHASTALSYAHGLATALELRGELMGHGGNRRVVAVVGDGSLTGGMAYEALNNLGHSGRRCVIVLNDNGRSYAPTVSRLSESLTSLRLHPTYLQARERLRRVLREIPGVGEFAYVGVHGVTSVLREIVTPHTFFETLGVRYVGPIDGHDIAVLEQSFRFAAEWDGPIVVHVLTEKGRGYAPAEQDEIQRLHDFRVPVNDDDLGVVPESYTDAFSRALVAAAERDDRVVALTAAMPGSTGLLPFQERFPRRCFDVGIAEQHEMTAAAGMAMGGLRPVVAVYSTFFTRALDQANLDVGLHRLPVVTVLEAAGLTGPNGPSHHGVLDLPLCLSIPDMTVFAPSSAEEVGVMLDTALSLAGPSSIRFPSTVAPTRCVGAGEGLHARLLRDGDGTVCFLAVGKLVGAALEAADLLERDGVDATVYDVRVVSPPDPRMLDAAAAHRVVVTAEDGFRHGGAGEFLAVALAGRCRATGEPPPGLRVCAVPRAYVAQGKPETLLAELGLDGPGLASCVRRALDGEPDPTLTIPLAPLQAGQPPLR